jgi:hypothetical protein
MAIYDFGLSVSAFGGLFGLVIPDIFVIHRQWPLSFSLCFVYAQRRHRAGDWWHIDGYG